MKKDDKLTFAVIGLGVGQRHAQSLFANPRCSLVYVYDIDHLKARNYAAQIENCRVALCYEDIISRQDIDAVVIASYDDSHYSQVVDALTAGKHIFAEKPLCLNLEQLSHIKQVWLASSNRLILRSNLVLRSATYYRWLREKVLSGHFGKLYSFDGDYLYGRLHKITDGWRGEIHNYSVMDGGGIHLIDLLLWVTGQRPTSVTAVGNKISTEKTRFVYEDFVAASLNFDSGMIGRITANFGCVNPHQHAVRVFGTRGTALHDDCGPRYYTSRDVQHEPEKIDLATIPKDKSSLVSEFVEAVFSGKDDSHETQSVFDGISVSAAINRALESGKREDVRYI